MAVADASGSDVANRYATVARERLRYLTRAEIECIGEAKLMFGPGEAKGELKKRLKRKTLGRRIAGVETVDKMTDRQIAAKVRQRFTESRSAIGSRRNHLTRPSSGRG